MKSALNAAFKSAWITLVIMIVLLAPGGSSLVPGEKTERIRSLVRASLFDYADWMADALVLKANYAALSLPRYLTIEQQREIVLGHLDLTRQINRLSYEITLLYSDPNVADPEIATQEKRAELDELLAREKQSGPVAEAVVQEQMQYILKELGLTSGGQTLPPILYRVTPLPYALIVSPRGEIRQEANISLLPGLTLEERIAIEDKVAESTGESTLVEGIGGVGVYPTMVMSTTDINWLAEVVAHEWTHNYLTLRPLGMRYDKTPELRTINETTATIAGEEVGRAFIARFYPEYLPPPPAPPAPAQPGEPTQPPPSPPAFDFRAEMRITRVRVDELLAEGKIEEAEAYMEERRQFFWDNGYLIRKLNQAYFAFHGAYNASPGGGAAGVDPVGPAVQELRARSDSLARFLNRIARVKSFEQLQKMVE